MSTRKIKDGKVDGEKVYFKGHAQATYMSDGRTVEGAISELQSGNNSSGDAYYLDCGTDLSVTEGTIDLSEWDKLASARIITLRFGGFIYASFRRSTTVFNRTLSTTFISHFDNGILDLLFVSFQKESDSIAWAIENSKDPMNAYPKSSISLTVYTISPNIFYVWDEVASLDLSFAEEIPYFANEYTFQFTSGTTPTSLTLPDTIQWVNGAPNIEANKTYQVSIVNNIGLIVSV